MFLFIKNAYKVLHICAPSITLWIVSLLVITAVGCARGTELNLEDHRPQVVETKKEIQTIAVPVSSSKALRQAEGQGTWTYATFLDCWKRFPESRQDFVINLKYLASTDFDWDALALDFTHNLAIRPTRTNIIFWAALTNQLFDARREKLLSEQNWIDFTFESARPIGLKALFDSQEQGYLARFDLETWDRILEVLKYNRKRPLGSSVWLSFLTMIAGMKTEPVNKSVKEFIQDDVFWGARLNETPDHYQELEKARVAALQRLGELGRADLLFESNYDLINR